MSDPRGEKSRSLLLPPAIAFSTGLIDMLGWLTLAHFISATITSDLLEVSAGVVPHTRLRWLEIGAVPVFLAGLVASYGVVRRCGADPSRAIRFMFLAQAAVLLVAATVAGAFAPAPAADRSVALGLLCVLTISLSNATMNILDHGAPTTWALTANCVRAGVALLDLATGRGDAEARGQDRATWRAIWPTVLAFLLGGVVAVLASRALGPRAWLVPLVTTLAYVGVPWRATSPSTPMRSRADKHR